MLFSLVTYLPSFLRPFIYEADLSLGDEKGTILLWGAGT